MEFTNFITLVKEEVEKRAGDNYNIKINDVIKNNGIVLSGLTVMEDDSNISPTIYLNNYFDAYEKDEISLDCVVDNVMEAYEKNKVCKSVDIKYFFDYSKVKDRIIYKLVNTKKNKKLLEDIPHINFHDLSIVFQFLIAEEPFGTATILIHNAHIRIWDVSVKELYETACQNTPRLNKYSIKGVKETIMEMLSSETNEEFGDNEFGIGKSDSIPMYVLSNENRINGAACMLYPELIKDFSKAVNNNLFIIPSSVHEVLLLPTENSTDSEDIKEMIREINSTQVEADEVLSDSVYYYDRILDEILIM